MVLCSLSVLLFLVVQLSKVGLKGHHLTRSEAVQLLKVVLVVQEVGLY